MDQGLYEQLLTRRVHKQLEALHPSLHAERRDVVPSESPAVLTQHLAQVILRALEGLKPEHRVDVANQVVETLLKQMGNRALDTGDTVEEQLQQLLSILPAGPLAVPVERPAIPLNASELLVNARGEHRIGAELVKELGSADQVDLLCSFLKWSGYNVLQDALKAFHARGGQLRGVQSRESLEGAGSLAGAAGAFARPQGARGPPGPPAGGAPGRAAPCTLPLYVGRDLAGFGVMTPEKPHRFGRACTTTRPAAAISFS